MARSTHRCAGPFPFAQGPLLLLSTPLAQWYARSPAAAQALRRAVDSRLNRTADPEDADDAAAAAAAFSSPTTTTELSVEAARGRARFLALSEPGDLDVRIFDDVWLGHALCVGDGGGRGGFGDATGGDSTDADDRRGGGGAPNVTILSFPPGLLADFPCAGGESGCRKGLNRYNWTSDGAPLIAHRVRKPQYVPMALERLHASPYASPQAVTCKPMKAMRASLPNSHCFARHWQWCTLPYRAAGMMKQSRPFKPPSPAEQQRRRVARRQSYA